MPKQTEQYRLGYYVEGELTDGITEERRWLTVDAQLRGLFEVIGNGVLDGWGLSQNSSSSFAVDVSPGSGVASFVSMLTESSQTVPSLLPSCDNYVFASTTPSTYWTRSPVFSAASSPTPGPGSILLGKITTDTEGITAIDTSGRSNISLLQTIRDAIKAHRHIGGDDNPSLINLPTDVQGLLSQANMPELDASIVSTGTLDAARIPKIDHISGLSNQGTLTHSQLDSFVESLTQVGRTLMGETALVNLLQLVLALKHQWPDVDEFLVNEMAMIPGISPDSYIDFDNTKFAVVDTRPQLLGGQHTISGTPGPASKAVTKSWDTQQEFEDSIRSGVSVDGDRILLKPTETKVYVDDFEEVGDWKTEIVDLSTNSGILELDSSTKISGDYSAKVGVNVDRSMNLAFLMTKNFTAQDWTGYDRVVFYLYTTSLEHGDIYFFVNDAIYGIQDSYTMVLERNEPTINRDTILNGWREISVDLTPYNRAAITSVGFFSSSQTGWDATKGFTLNVDELYVTSGNAFLESGYARFTYGGSTPQDFWRVRWDAVMPSGTVLKVRTRLANDPSQFDPLSPTPAPWSAYNATSGFTVSNPTGLPYRYIQLEPLLEASSDNKHSPALRRLHLDSRIVSVEASFVIDTQDQWESGTNYDVDTTTVPGSIRIAAADQVDHVFYGTPTKVVHADEGFNTLFSSTGTTLPISTRQALAGEASKFGQLSSVRRGSDGTIWAADTDNDRVVQINESGALIFGLYGSFLKAPADPYGKEDSGPGSNTDVEIPETEESESEEVAPALLHAQYNPATRVLSAVFDGDLEMIHDTGTTFDRNKLFLKTGSHNVYFNSQTAFGLFGIDPARYDKWVFSSNPFKQQFDFTSHILQAELTQADAAALSSTADFIVPSVTISEPYEQQIIPPGSVTIRVTTPNFSVGTESEENNGIRFRLDSGTYHYVRFRQITFATVPAGHHTAEVWLVDGNDSLLQNPEAKAAVSFVVHAGAYVDPIVSIISPLQGQTVSGASVSVVFGVLNHPILPVGSFLRYFVDGGAWQDHRSYAPVVLTGLSAGAHTVTLVLVDEFGDEIVAAYSRASTTFNYGISATLSLRLYVDKGAIRGSSRADVTETPEKNVMVDVAHVTIANMYAPIDAQVVPAEMSSLNPSGGQTLLVGKLRSPSTTYGLSLPGGDTTVSLPNDAIFGTNYLDGHSVVQHDASGAVIFTNNAAKFSDTKANAKSYLGSAFKVSDSELMMADAIRHRAIMTYTDLATQSPKIIWEYSADRLVSDFQIVEQTERSISVQDTTCSPDEIYVKTGMKVVWRNSSSVQIQIYSGTVTPAEFAADPDLTLYGDDFFSKELQPGEEFVFQFDNVGDFGWFAHPNIVTGSVRVSAARISSEDQYLIVEKDAEPTIYGARVIRVDAWGNVVWSFGKGILYDPKDVRALVNDAVMISS